MKALVVGGDSLIGGALCQTLQQRGDRVMRTTRRSGCAESDGWLSLDLAASVPAPSPACDVVFFCAAMTGFAANRESPVLAERVNVAAPAALAGRLVERGARVILLSTSAVLDCQQPHMRPDRPYAPRGLYGLHKAAAERAFLALGPQACVLRLTKVLAQGENRLAEWTRALRQGRPVRAFDDHRISPLALDQVVSALLAVADQSGGGIYQVSGSDDLSYAELAQELARRLQAAPRLVQVCSALSAGIPADEVTPYTSLDCSRLTELCGFVPPPAAAVLDRVLQ